jgi:osmoprotectant transport system ATP-binding protein
LVSDFIGRSDLGLKLLGLLSVADRLHAGESAPGEPILASASLREALSAFVVRQTDRLPVVDAQGRPVGAIGLSDLLRRAE